MGFQPVSFKWLKLLKNDGLEARPTRRNGFCILLQKHTFRPANAGRFS